MSERKSILNTFRNLLLPMTVIVAGLGAAGCSGEHELPNDDCSNPIPKDRVVQLLVSSGVDEKNANIKVAKLSSPMCSVDLSDGSDTIGITADDAAEIIANNIESPVGPDQLVELLDFRGERTTGWTNCISDKSVVSLPSAITDLSQVVEPEDLAKVLAELIHSSSICTRGKDDETRQRYIGIDSLKTVVDEYMTTHTSVSMPNIGGLSQTTVTVSVN